MTGTRPRWRTVTETRAGSSEMPVEPRRYTTACVLLKQPDKQKTARSLQGLDLGPYLELLAALPGQALCERGQ
jgi:hypothetical protein